MRCREDRRPTKKTRQKAGSDCVTGTSHHGDALQDGSRKSARQLWADDLTFQQVIFKIVDDIIGDQKERDVQVTQFFQRR